MLKNKKIALVGAGVIGITHASIMSFLSHPFDAICDTNREKALALATDGCEVFTNYEEMIDTVSPYAVHICTPHYLHTRMILYALERNIHVLCEKPLCIREDEVELILEAEKRSSANLGICFQNRYIETNSFVKEYVKDKKIISAHGCVVWSRTPEYYRSAPWRGKYETEGGGVLINQAIHTLDLLIWLLGEPKTVSAMTSNLVLGRTVEVEDTVSASFDGAQPFTFFATNTSKQDMPVKIDIILSNGEIINLTPQEVIINGATAFKPSPTKANGKLCYGSGHLPLITDFYECLMKRKRFPINGREGAKSIRCVLAAYRSGGRAEKIR